MAHIVTSTQKRSGLDESEICIYCLEPFEEPNLSNGYAGEVRYNHVGGENHNEFHRDCLVSWCRVTPICPWDRVEIDTSSLFTKIEQAELRARQALENSKKAALINFVAGVTGLVALQVITSATAAVINSVEKESVFMDQVKRFATASLFESGFIGLTVSSLRLEKRVEGLGALFIAAAGLTAAKVNSTVELEQLPITGIISFLNAIGLFTTFAILSGCRHEVLKNVVPLEKKKILRGTVIGSCLTASLIYTRVISDSFTIPVSAISAAIISYIQRYSDLNFE